MEVNNVENCTEKGLNLEGICALDGLGLRYALERHKTLELCLIACRQNWSAMAYVPEELKPAVMREYYESIVDRVATGDVLFDFADYETGTGFVFYMVKENDFGFGSYAPSRYEKLGRKVIEFKKVTMKDELVKILAQWAEKHGLTDSTLHRAKYYPV